MIYDSLNLVLIELFHDDLARRAMRPDHASDHRALFMLGVSPLFGGLNLQARECCTTAPTRVQQDAQIPRCYRRFDC
jgi:hypothetical protein